MVTPTVCQNAFLETRRAATLNYFAVTPTHTVVVGRVPACRRGGGRKTRAPETHKDTKAHHCVSLIIRARECRAALRALE